MRTSSDHDELPADRHDARRFDIELFIAHPSLTPEEITAALGIRAGHYHKVGERRQTPKGTLLVGCYKDTRWRYVERHEITYQYFAKQVTAFVDKLQPHQKFLHEVRSSGGAACLAIAFFLDGKHLGDQIPQSTLAKLVALDLDLGIECF